jgi:hypothetical protein
MAALSTIWAVGLSVLGVYIFKRSEDKKLFTGGLNINLPEQFTSPKPAAKPTRPYYNN